MSKLGATALAVAVGYLLFRILVGLAMLLYYIVKMAVLLPIALIGLCAGNVTIRRGTSEPASDLNLRPPPPTQLAPPELGPASIPTTGDWRQDRETLKQLLAEGKIK